MNSINNQKIYFPKSTEVISEILKKNGLGETLEEAVEKIVQKKNCRLNIVYDASRDFIEKNISEKDFILSLQKQLETSDKTAENIAKDVKEKLFPLAEKVTIGEQLPENEDLDEDVPVAEKPISEQKIREKKIKTIEPIPKETVPKVIQKMGPDSYREPIE